MVDNKKDLTTRGTPAETKDDWKHIWEGVQRAHDGWFVVKFPVFVFGNWKVLAMGGAGAMAMFGREIVTALGYLK